VYIALLVAWTIVDPPVASQYRQSLESDQFMMVCQTGGSGIIIFAIILGWSCVLLLVGIVLSFLTRNLAEAYNESKPVSLSVYIYSFSAVILIPILFSKFRGACIDRCQNNPLSNAFSSRSQCSRCVYCHGCGACVQHSRNFDRALLEQDCAYQERSWR
jgi:hypothetical protein